MPKFTNRLDELLADAVLSTGATRQTARLALDTYVKTLNLQTFADQIKQITSIPELNFLQSIGVPKQIYQIFLKQIEMLVTNGGH